MATVVSEQTSNISKSSRSLDGIREKVQDLTVRKEEIEAKMRKIEYSMKEIDSQTREKVKNWSKDADRIINKARTLEEKARTLEEKPKEKSCFLRPRDEKLDEKLGKMIQEVEEVYQKGNFSDGFPLIDVHLVSGVTLPAAKLVGETTAIKYKKEIWECLMNDEDRKIGICGNRGIGKTTIMKNINNKLLKESTDKFDKVIWVTVSKEFSFTKLRKDILHALDGDILTYEYETRIEFTKVLEGKKRYVLILDDVHEEFSLKEVGIPEPDKTNGCKIVLTTRSPKVCVKMDCKEFQVGLLKKEEAWNLFSDKLGHAADFTKFPNLQEIKKIVADQCSCLPLAITTIASNMNTIVSKKNGGDDIQNWRIALNDLRKRIKDAKDKGGKIMEERLKFSYDGLEDLKAQNCFLYFGLYPKDFEISKRELIEYWIVEGFVDETSSKEAIAKGYGLLNKLEKCCLLESTSNRSVKMHDLVWDVALKIMSVDPQFMMKAGKKLMKLPAAQEWKDDLQKVSLIRNCISEIPSEMQSKCEKLSTFLFRENPLESISDSFFQRMSNLKVLDLSYTGIQILPNSISELENLSALLLRWCWRLKHVPSLAKLGKLKRLDLRHSGIEDIPQGMEFLVNLIYLNLCTEYLKMFPTGLLPKLSRLQCLIVWWGSDTLTVRGEEVVSLTKLETFAGQFYKPGDFNTYVRAMRSGGGPCKFHLQLGPSNPFRGDQRSIDFEEEGGHFNKHVGLKRSNIGGNGRDALVLPDGIEFLSIEECNDVKSLCDVGSLKTDCLKYCDISNCVQIESVLRTSNDGTCLQSLEVLLLVELENLRVLFSPSVSSSSQPPLTQPAKPTQMPPEPPAKPTQVPPEPPATQMPPEAPATQPAKPTQMPPEPPATQMLPEAPATQPAKPTQMLPEPPATQMLPEQPAKPQPQPPAMPPRQQPITFSNIQQLFIIKCPNITKLFAHGLLLRLQNLKEIYVHDCTGMEEIFAERGKEENTSFKITLPKLRCLSLWKLPQLKSIVSSKATMVCESIQQITICSCPNLERFPLSLPMVNGSPSPPFSLEYITIYGQPKPLKWDHPNAESVLKPFFR